MLNFLSNRQTICPERLHRSSLPLAMSERFNVSAYLLALGTGSILCFGHLRRYWWSSNCLFTVLKDLTGRRLELKCSLMAAEPHSIPSEEVGKHHCKDQFSNAVMGPLEDST